jgi:hypothetical protein
MNGAIASRNLGWMLATTLIVGLTPGVATAAPGGQIRFKVPQPFRVGAHVYESGVIAIRNESSYNPTTSILRVWVNDECLGMMTAHHSQSEQPPEATEALFHRGSDGRLVMVGFRVDGRPKATTYRFQDSWDATALNNAQTDLPSTISPEAARRAASAKLSVSTVNTSSD